MRRALGVLSLLLVIPSFSARGADFAPPTGADVAPPMESNFFISEIRLGVLAHGVGSPERGGADLNAEILFIKPFRASGWTDVLIPRPQLGATINFAGKTSTAYAGVAWRTNLFDTAFFSEISFGASVNNGQLDERHNGMNPLGCHVLFRESGSLGYDFDSHWSVMATFEHSSNANLCNKNRGLSNIGARIGYRF